MKQILTQHIQEQKEGSSRKKVGFFSSLLFSLAMSCAIIDNRPYSCLGGYYEIGSFNTKYWPSISTDFINDLDISELIQEEIEFYPGLYQVSPRGYTRNSFEDYYVLAFNPSPNKEKEEDKKEKDIYPNWLTGESVLKEEEILCDKYAALKVA